MKEQFLLSGLKAVYALILQRQGEQARSNQVLMNSDCMRPNEEAELEEIKSFMHSELGKREFLLHALTFVLNENFFQRMANYGAALIPPNSLFDDLLRHVPVRSRKLKSIEDLIEMIDSTDRLDAVAAALFYVHMAVTGDCAKTYDQRLLPVSQQRAVRAIKDIDVLLAQGQIDERVRHAVVTVVANAHGLVRKQAVMQKLIAAS